MRTGGAEPPHLAALRTGVPGGTVCRGRGRSPAPPASPAGIALSAATPRRGRRGRSTGVPPGEATRQGAPTGDRMRATASFAPARPWPQQVPGAGSQASLASLAQQLRREVCGANQQGADKGHARGI